MSLDPSQIFSFLNTPFFQTTIFVLRIVLLVVSAAMLGFIIWALIKTLYLKRLFLWDIKEFATVQPYAAKKLYGPWQKIKQRLEGGLESEYKLAVIEADSIVDDILKSMGFTGVTFSDRLANLTPAILPNLKDVIAAHEIRNNIVHNPDFRISLNEAKRVVEIYQTALTESQAL